MTPFDACPCLQLLTCRVSCRVGEQNEDDFPLGEYDMRMCSVKEAKLPNKTNTFALITPKRNIYLQASTYKDMLMWMNAMNDAKKVWHDV